MSPALSSLSATEPVAAARSPGCGCQAPPAPDMLLIRHANDTYRLAGLVPSYREIRVALPGLTLRENLALQTQINHDYLECGCAQGAAALRVAALPGWAGLFLLWAFTGGVSGRAVLVVLVLTGSISLTAKLSTLLRARWRLARRLHVLRQTLKSPQERRPSRRAVLLSRLP